MKLLFLLLVCFSASLNLRLYAAEKVLVTFNGERLGLAPKLQQKLIDRSLALLATCAYYEEHSPEEFTSVQTARYLRVTFLEERLVRVAVLKKPVKVNELLITLPAVSSRLWVQSPDRTFAFSKFQYRKAAEVDALLDEILAANRKEEFERLYQAWHAEAEKIKLSSRTTDYIALPSYRKIVGLGKPVLPHLTQKMREDKGLDFMLAYAVVEICGWNPDKFRGAGGEQGFRDRVLRKLEQGGR